LWDVQENAGRTVLAAHTDSVLAACFSPDGRRLVSGSADRTVRVWDVETGKVLATFPHDEIVGCVALNREGLLATAAHDAAVRLWDLSSGVPKGAIRNLDARLNSMCFSPDGKRLFTATHDGTVQSWDASSQRSIRTFAHQLELVSSVSVSPDGKLLAAGGKVSHSILLWDTETGLPLEALTGHESPVRCVQFSASGRLLASASDDQSVRLWDLSPRRCIAAFRGSHARIFGVCFSPDDSMMASGDESGEVRLWDIASRRCLAVYEGKSGSLFGISFTADARRLVYWGTGGKITVQDLYYFDRHIEGNREYWVDRLSARSKSGAISLE